MFATKEWVINLLSKLFKKTLINQQDNDYKNIPFQFAIDDNGNYGYIKDGADTVTPFKTFDTKLYSYFIDSGDRVSESHYMSRTINLEKGTYLALCTGSIGVGRGSDTTSGIKATQGVFVVTTTGGGI